MITNKDLSYFSQHSFHCLVLVKILLILLTMIPPLSTHYISVSSTWSHPEAIHVASGGLGELPSQLLSTKTVLGFLDFTTTVSDAVIKFTAPGGQK